MPAELTAIRVMCSGRVEPTMIRMLPERGGRRIGASLPSR
ncbi:hypothetical protein [Accumulibacter sp.]|nr:hypothetical protein [Accumulibacter sp.]